MYSLRARYYDPFNGRFLSRDTFPVNFRNPIELNRYGYAANNPVNFSDPSGLTLFGFSLDTSDRGARTMTAGQLVRGALYRLYTRYYLAVAGSSPYACFFGELGIEIGLEIVLANQGGLPPDADVDIPGCAAGHDGDIDIDIDVDLPGGGSGGNVTVPDAPGDLPGNGGADLPGSGPGSDTGNGVGNEFDGSPGDDVTNGGNSGSDGNGNAPGGGSDAGDFCSFSEDTLVATGDDPIAIGEIAVGDLVLAYNEASGEVDEYEVLATWVHLDDVALLTIDGETLETTLDHPFYTSEGEWVAAGELEIGDLILNSDGDYGEVESISTADTIQSMFNLTVDEAHTYFVGDGQWLVHNDCNDDIINETNQGAGNFISQHTLSPEDALDTGLEWLDNDYVEIDSGIFRSSQANPDGTFNQFRMDTGSLTGQHAPLSGHVHFEVVELTLRHPNGKHIVNNHVPIE